jgi:hypothetical protein
MNSSNLKCPSAQPDMAHAEVLGVLQHGDIPKLTYLTESLPVSADVLAMVGQATPTEVFRFAASCAERSCQHFDGVDCKLASRIVAGLTPVVDALPPCRLRTSCRWYAQEGRPACLRCPQVVTHTRSPSDHLRAIAQPT